MAPRQRLLSEVVFDPLVDLTIASFAVIFESLVFSALLNAPKHHFFNTKRQDRVSKSNS